MKKFARAAGHHQERQIGDDIGHRGIHDRGRQLGRPQPRGNDIGIPFRQRSLDGIAGDHGIVHQQPQGNDQGGDGNLLDIDAEQIHRAKRHRQGDGDGDRHQHCRTPLPESEPRNQHHQRDRLVERIHEQADVFFHLQRLVRGARDDQILGKILLHRRKLGVDAFAECVDLLAILHLDSNRYGAAATPVPVLICPGQVVQIFRRALVAAGNIDQVAQIDWALRRDEEEPRP